MKDFSKALGGRCANARNQGATLGNIGQIYDSGAYTASRSEIQKKRKRDRVRERSDYSLHIPGLIYISVETPFLRLLKPLEHPAASLCQVS